MLYCISINIERFDPVQGKQSEGLQHCKYQWFPNQHFLQFKLTRTFYFGKTDVTYSAVQHQRLSPKFCMTFH